VNSAVEPVLNNFSFVVIVTEAPAASFVSASDSIKVNVKAATV
jgi:hypothetical protein